MKIPKNSTTSRRAFSLPELLGVMAIVGLLAGSGYAVLSGIHDSTKKQKLDSEVATLNSAVATYLGFGGNLDDVESPEEALAQLRSIAASDQAKHIPGLSGSMVDSRIAGVASSDADEGKPRVVWNADKKAFEIATTGDGIRSFFLNADDAEVEKSEDTREFAFLYAKEDTWLWDYTEESFSATSGPSEVATYDPITIVNNPTPPTAINPDPDPEDEPTTLEVPTFSTPGGNYSIRDYDLGTTISNPNPAGSSEIYYQADHGNWIVYTPGTVIDIEPDAIIAAQVIASNSDWLDSSRAEETYGVEPTQLNAPTIIPSSSTFGVFNDRLITVTLENTNGEDPATMQYKIGGGEWVDYDDFLLLDRVDFEGGALIYSRATSSDPYYADSDNGFSALTVEPLELAGVANGVFHDPNGGCNMVTNLPYHNSSSDYFEWGRITNYYGNPYYGLTKSWMDFDGYQADDIALGNRFQIGDLDYYNGKILSDSGADSVNLQLDLAFDISGTTYNTVFDYEFELINTLNDNYDLYGWPSADYVQIDRPNSSTLFDIDGLTFELVLEFGETTADGFSNFDEFHVREQHDANSSLYATLYDRTESTGSINGDGSANGNGNGSENGDGGVGDGNGNAGGNAGDGDDGDDGDDDDAGEADGGDVDDGWW